MAGAPTKYTPQIGEQICELTASSSKSLHTIAKEVGIPYGTIRSWIYTTPEFSVIYARAKDDQADFLAEEIVEIADDSSGDTEEVDLGGVKVQVENKEFVQRSKLRIDARKWVAAKLKPKRYGDKLDVTSDGEKLNQEVIIKGEKFADKP